jgi:DDE_Tnp_1-associated
MSSTFDRRGCYHVTPSLHGSAKRNLSENVVRRQKWREGDGQKRSILRMMLPLCLIYFFMEDYSLLYFLSQISDFRTKRGRRHVLANILAMTVMAVLSGRTGLKSIGRFMKQNEPALTSVFDLKHGCPSYGTVWSMLNNIAFEEMNKALFKWINHHAPLMEVDFVSVDGKALCSTLKGVGTDAQNFVYLVSIYGTLNNLVYSASKNEQKKDHEAEVVREMLRAIGKNHDLDLSNLSLRADAIHCQKKQQIFLFL